MTSCTDCARDLNSFNPACLGCGRRYLRDIQWRRMPDGEKREWLRKVMVTWQFYGHAESDLRGPARLVKHAGGPRD
jgi:predicted Fe-S protein YdhL (DUF1289 family)